MQRLAIILALISGFFGIQNSVLAAVGNTNPTHLEEIDILKCQDTPAENKIEGEPMFWACYIKQGIYKTHLFKNEKDMEAFKEDLKVKGIPFIVIDNETGEEI